MSKSSITMRTKNNRIFLFGLVLTLTMGMCLSVQDARAQQDPQYTMYFWNLQALNPGYAGTSGVFSVTGLSRHQWTGLTGAPSTQSLVLSTPLRNRAIGLGFSIVHDEVGPVTTNLLYGDIAYKLKLSNKSKLSLGIKGGVNLFSADLSQLEGVGSDDPLLSGMHTSTTPNFGFGAYYYSKKHYLGLSIPKLVENNILESTTTGTTVNTLLEKRHFFLIGGYVFDITRNTKLRPSFVLKAVQGAPVSADISALVFFEDAFNLGAAYRPGDSVSGILGYDFTDQLRAGYAYDFTLSDIRDHSSGSHEFMLGYDLRSRKERTLSPRYF